MKSRYLLLIVLLSFSFGTEYSKADDGHPIAIRIAENGGFAIESMWGLKVGAGSVGKLDASAYGLKSTGKEVAVVEKQVVVHRAANEDSVSVDELENAPADDPNAIVVKSVSSADWGNTKLGRRQFAIISVDGLDVYCFNQVTPQQATKWVEGIAKDQLSKRPRVVIANGITFDEAACLSISKALEPTLFVVNESLESCGESKVVAVPHNTVAVSSKQDESETRFVALGTTPYEMSDEYSELFAKKESACSASRDMFAKLSVAQMNFKPANGTHTPRWNAEHMMGRELLFFSQIYNAVDPAIPVMNLNPKQMPKDYKYAHEDWTGAEEARQMKRVEDFTRRFGYLLDGMDLNKKAKGSQFWTPLALLRQMERHYNEHSANVVKKMQLDGWPK